MTTSQARTKDRSSAVVWIDEQHAIVARSKGADRLSMLTVDRANDPEVEFLARVVREVGDGEQVLIVGSGPVRLALEREYVSISHRPERLIAGPAAFRYGTSEMLDRLRRMAAA